MSENKQLTIDEIVKALECCKGGWCISKNCPLNEFEDDGCEHILAKYALNLINNLLTENEFLAEDVCRLEVKCEWLEKENESQKAEIERLQGKVKVRELIITKLKTGSNAYVSLTSNSLEYLEIKAEAIKEFAERFEGNVPHIEGETTMECVKNAIKQTLKETVGD